MNPLRSMRNNPRKTAAALVVAGIVGAYFIAPVTFAAGVTSIVNYVATSTVILGAAAVAAAATVIFAGIRALSAMASWFKKGNGNPKRSDDSVGMKDSHGMMNGAGLDRVVTPNKTSKPEPHTQAMPSVEKTTAQTQLSDRDDTQESEATQFGFGISPN